MKTKAFLLAIAACCMIASSCKKPEKTKTVNCSSTQVFMDTAVLLVLGQSNAANAGETLYSASCSNTFSFYNGELFPLSDPLKGANGNGGSVWSRLGDLLVQNGFAHTVIIAPVAIGGTSVSEWKPGGQYNHLIVEAIASLNSRSLTITHVLWHQGEQDNALFHTTSTPQQNALRYRGEFLELVAQLRTLGVAAPVFPAIVSRCGDAPADPFLAQAQLGLASDSLGIYNGPNTDLLGSDYRYDNCHFNDLGLRVHAVLWADKLFAHR